MYHLNFYPNGIVEREALEGFLRRRDDAGASVESVHDESLQIFCLQL